MGLSYLPLNTKTKSLNLQGLVHLYYYKNQITEVHMQGTRLASAVLTLLAPSTHSVLSRHVWVEGGSSCNLQAMTWSSCPTTGNLYVSQTRCHNKGFLLGCI